MLVSAVARAVLHYFTLVTQLQYVQSVIISFRGSPPKDDCITCETFLASWIYVYKAKLPLQICYVSGRIIYKIRKIFSHEHEEISSACHPQ